LVLFGVGIVDRATLAWRRIRDGVLRLRLRVQAALAKDEPAATSLPPPTTRRSASPPSKPSQRPPAPVVIDGDDSPAARRDPYETDLLLFLGFFVPIAVFFLPKTPIFGGTKHWLPAYPFLAVFAGRGFDVLAAALERAARAIP